MSLRTLVRPLWLMAVLVVAWSAPAEAKPRFKALGESFGPVVTDGVRWAAYQPIRGQTRVIDTRERVAYTVLTPPDCQRPFAVGGDIAAIGGGQLMWQCVPGGRNRPRLLDLEARVVHDPAPAVGENTLTDPYLSDDPLLGVGSQWIERNYLTGTGKVYVRVYVNWRTGAVRTNPGTEREAVNLDDPGLVQPLCAPLRRRFLDDPPTVFWEPFTYNGRYGLSLPLGGGRVVLQRCNARPKTLGARTDARLAGGLVTWTDQRGFHAYAPTTRKRKDFDSLPGGFVARTLNRIYVSQASLNGPWTVRYAAWRPPPTTRKPG